MATLLWTSGGGGYWSTTGFRGTRVDGVISTSTRAVDRDPAPVSRPRQTHGLAEFWEPPVTIDIDTATSLETSRTRRFTGLRRAGAALALTAAAGGAFAVLAPAADAGAFSVAYTGGDGVALRSAPAANARLAPMVVWRDGTPVTIICQTSSPDAVGPRANHIFDQVAYGARSAPTYIPDAYVAGTAAANVFTTGIPRCGAPAPAPTPAPAPSGNAAAEKAISWMSARIGSTQYDGYCLAAVYQAYLAAGRNITAGLPYAQSHDSAYSYWTVAANRHPGDHNPPRGALVFFRSAAGAPGHVAISLGGGQMISTYDGRTHAIHTMAISSYDPSRYLGWVGV